MVAHTKKPFMEVLCSKPISAIVPTLESSATAAGTNPVLDERPFSTGATIHPKLGGFSIGSTQLSNDSVEYITSILPRPQAPRALSQEEIATLMKQIPCFIEGDAPVNNIEDLFPATWRVLVDLDDDHNISFMAQLSFGTSESVVSPILHM